MTQVIEYNENNYSDFEWFEGFAVIRFYADWCKPCVQNFPIFAELATYYAEVNPEVKFGKINVDQEPELARAFGVMSIPTVVFLKNGREVDRKVGLMPETALEAALKQHL